MSGLESLQLLVVDDDEFAIDLFLGALEGLGIENCQSALSGQQALAMIDAADAAIDLIICDIEMPDMDGLELLRRLAEAGFKGKIALISGLESEVLRMARQLGEAHDLSVIGAVQKPIKRDALSALLASVVQDSSRGGSPRVRHHVLAADIEAALAKDEFRLYYQPKIDVAGERIYGAEALLRWYSSRFDSIVSPDDFIPVAEESGLINEITQCVIEKALIDIRLWKDQGCHFRVSINVSGKNLSQLDFATRLSATLREHGVEPEDIMVEITETSLTADVTSVLEVLARLKMQRIDLSIDDFGTGYSSMAQLQKIPFVELKIDRSFVNGAGENASTRSILESSARLARQLGIASVAEGVETREDWDLVAALGIDLVQGYFIARPMPGEDFLAWTAGWAGVPVS